MDVTEKIVEKCLKCKETLTVSDASSVVIGSMKVCYQEGTLLKEVEKKIGEGMFNRMCNLLLSTTLASMYGTAVGMKDTEKAKEFGKEIGAEPTIAIVATDLKEGS